MHRTGHGPVTREVQLSGHAELNGELYSTPALGGCTGYRSGGTKVSASRGNKAELLNKGGQREVCKRVRTKL